MYQYLPERIIIDQAVEHEPLTQEILQRFSKVPQVFVENYAWHKDEPSQDPEANHLTRGKKTLHLKYFKGDAFKLCPGVTNGAVCCNYFTIDFVENCPFECTYCILQAFLNKPVITVHANVGDILEQVQNHVLQHPQRLFRVGTGEHSDSLALDPALGLNRHLIRFFAKLPNAVLELKTKSDHVDHLLDLPHGGKTVIAWSINPEYLVTHEEFKTARLHERLLAAQKASEAGYKIAFHFDPLIQYPDWKSGYAEVVRLLTQTIEPQRIAWISLGSLRYLPKLKQVVEERFPNSRIFLGEFVPVGDGKMRYLKHIRQEMFHFMEDQLRQWAPQVPLYLCMEKASVWENSMTAHPHHSEELEQMISSQFQQNFSEAGGANE
ncbi:MAG: DNA photolyase [SAR324 cluster bacterium]|nr:DNA photolyase [SAR324 cluster bacterium]